MNLLKKIVLSSSSLVLADQAIFSATNFLLTLFLAQKLSIKNFGLFSMIVLVTFLIMSITNALIIQPFQVSFAKVTKKSAYYVFLFFGLAVLLFFSLFLVKLLVIFSPKNSDFIALSNAGICFISGYLIQDFFRKLFLGIAKVTVVILIDVLFLLLISIAFFYFKNQITIYNSLLIIGIANIFSSIPGFYFILKNYKESISWKSFFKMHVVQGKWLLYVAVLQWCSSNFFVLISGAYLGIEALGALRLVQSFFGIINVILQTVENYFLPKIAHLHNKSVINAKRYLIEITFYGAILFGVLLLILSIFSKEIIIVAGGNQYAKYGFVVKIIAILYFFIFISYPFRITVRILALNKIFFTGYLLSFISSLITFHFLLKYSGLQGAVIGLVINQIIMILYWENQLRKNHILLWK